jgi:hypothetical protein
MKNELIIEEPTKHGLLFEDNNGCWQAIAMRYLVGGGREVKYERISEIEYKRLFALIAYRDINTRLPGDIWIPIFWQ